MRYNPYEPTKKSSPLLISIMLTAFFVLLSTIAINPNILFQFQKKFQTSKTQFITKVLELAGETPESAPIALIGSCENIENKDECESVEICSWESKAIACDFDNGICPQACKYIPNGVINCNALATDPETCNNLPGNYCIWEEESCFGDYPSIESCSGTMILPESCLQSN